MNDESLFSASEVARVLGYTRQNIHKQLDLIRADGEKPMSGNSAKAWKIGSLPQPLIPRLENVRARKGYATIEHLLQGPLTRFALPVPLAKIRRPVIQT